MIDDIIMALLELDPNHFHYTRKIIEFFFSANFHTNHPHGDSIANSRLRGELRL